MKFFFRFKSSVIVCSSSFSFGSLNVISRLLVVILFLVRVS